MTFSPFIIWAKATFFFEQLFSVVARTWLGLKSVRLFLDPKFQFLAQKSNFCHTTPILVDDPFLAPVMTVNFPPWERFFDFLFRSYSSYTLYDLIKEHFLRRLLLGWDLIMGSVCHLVTRGSLAWLSRSSMTTQHRTISKDKMPLRTMKIGRASQR